MTMDERIRQEARLIILRELNGQPNGSLTSTTLRDHLQEVWWIDRERGWVESEMAWMAEMGAITIVSAGSVKIARLADRGKRHLRRASLIGGIMAPSEPVETT